MKIALDSDLNGVLLKKNILSFLENKTDIEVCDLKYLSEFPEQDYPDIAVNMAMKIKEKYYDRGILICGTGLGMAICANKIPGIYAGACHDVYSAERLVKSNNAQILTFGAFVIGIESAKKIVEAWLLSNFEGGKSLPKVTRLKEIEKEIYKN